MSLTDVGREGWRLITVPFGWSERLKNDEEHARSRFKAPRTATEITTNHYDTLPWSYGNRFTKRRLDERYASDPRVRVTRETIDPRFCPLVNHVGFKRMISAERSAPISVPSARPRRVKSLEMQKVQDFSEAAGFNAPASTRGLTRS